MTVDVSDAYRCDDTEPIVPGRFRKALVHTVDDAVSEETTAKLGEFLHANTALMRRCGDPDGAWEFGWELSNLDEHLPDVCSKLRRTLFESCTPTVQQALGVHEFNVTGVEMAARLYHQGGHCCWHDDAFGDEGEMDPYRRVAFAFYLHTEPKRFTGGELEFLDGATVEPKARSLVLYHPIQTHRIRTVECWAAEALHGCWSIDGWVLGDYPDGWPDRLRQLRCAVQ
jgi:hypothetical protein